MTMSGGVPVGPSWSFLECDDEVDKGEEEDSPIRRSRRRKFRERSSEGGLQQGQEENQATGAPCVTVHLHMVVELGELWRCSGAGACWAGCRERELEREKLPLINRLHLLCLGTPNLSGTVGIKTCRKALEDRGRSCSLISNAGGDGDAAAGVREACCDFAVVLWAV